MDFSPLDQKDTMDSDELKWLINIAVNEVNRIIFNCGPQRTVDM